MTVPAGVVRHGPGQGHHLSARAGTRATFKVRGDDTAGAYAVVEWEHEASTPGPPLHIHDREEEAFYVLNGTVRVVVGDEPTEAGAGSFVLIPRGTPHTFSVTGDVAARLLIILSPPGYEGFWEELSSATGGGLSQPSPELMSALGHKYGMRVVPQGE